MPSQDKSVYRRRPIDKRNPLMFFSSPPFPPLSLKKINEKISSDKD